MASIEQAVRARGAIVVLAWGLGAGLVSGAAADPAPQAAASASPPAASQATASRIGLLPIHAIAVDLDALPGSKSDKKSKGSDLAALQQLWDSYLKGAGFNVIEFDVDAHDLGENGAGRVARLCGWAKQNNVRIAPTLIGAEEGKPLPADYANLAASFVGKVIANLGAAGLPSYTQIVFYQLERPLNHPGSHGAMEAGAAAALLKAAAENVRAAEQAGLASAGLQPTPLLVSSSFDYELIRRGAIVSTPISDESYTQAYGGLRDYLLTVFGAAPVEATSVQWFPGSLSSDGVDRLADLVNRLEGDLPGKLLIVDTGYSSAAGSDTAQARYYQVALNNLCDLRANQGVDSPFAGILWRSALDAGKADDKGSATPKASELTRMWDDPNADATEARSWLNRVQSRFGLLARGKDGRDALAPKVAFRVMSSLESALAQSPQASDALAAVKELGDAGKTGTMGTAVKSRLQNALFGMLDSWLTKTADNLFETPSEQPAAAPGTQQPRPDIQVWGPASSLPGAVKVGVPVPITVTLFNAGNAVANDATVSLRDSKRNDLVRMNPISIPPNGQSTVELTWIPADPGAIKVTAEVFCTNDSDPSANSNQTRIGDFVVQPGSAPPRPPKHFDQALAIGDRAVMVSSASPSSPSPSGGSKPGEGTRTMMATQTGAGFASIEGVSAPRVMMAESPSPPLTSTSSKTSTSTRSMTGSSTPTSSKPAPSGTTSSAMSGPSAGGPSPTSSAAAPAPAPRPEPITMTLANPYSSAFRNVTATLRIDDAVVSTRSIGTLVPHQRRTVSFSEWSPPRPGTYRLRADLEGLGPLNNRLTSSATSTITISGTGAAPQMAPMPDVQARSITGTRSLTPLVAATSSQPVRGFGGFTSSRGLGGGVRSLTAGGFVLGLSANSILLRPFPPASGAPVAVSVQLSNLERTPVRGARVAVRVDGELLGEIVTDVPASGTAMASGFKEWMAKPGRHDIRATVTVGSGRGEALKPIIVTGVGQGLGRPGFVAGQGLKQGFGKSALPPGQAKKGGFKSMTPSGRSVPGVDLQIATTDIRFIPPLPTSGTPMTVAIQVHNLGTSPVSDAQVLAVITAGGAEVARKQFTAAVPAGGITALEWPLTAPAGTPLVVTVTATSADDSNPANNQAHATATGKPAIKTMPRTTVRTTP